MQTPDAIAALQALLHKYPQVRYSAARDRITIHPISAEGFEITLIVRPAGCSVSFEGWHEDYPDTAEALEVVGFGLSRAARLAVAYRDRTPYKWTLEAERAGKWVSVSAVGLLLYPFWLRKRIRFLQNRVLEAA
jgi:hypothetical protein